MWSQFFPQKILFTKLFGKKSHLNVFQKCCPKRLQDALLSLTAAKPTGKRDKNQLPDPSYVRRFVERNGLSLRKTSQISMGRAVMFPAVIRLWFQDICSFLAGPELQKEQIWLGTPSGPHLYVRGNLIYFITTSLSVGNMKILK